MYYLCFIVLYDVISIFQFSTVIVCNNTKRHHPFIIAKRFRGFVGHKKK